MVFKEMVIQSPRYGRMPKLEFQGAWLEAISFVPGTLVCASYQDACLTLSANHGRATPNTVRMICVKSKQVRGRPRTLLTLDGFLLKRYGFHVGDRVVLQLSPNMIQITRVSHFTTVEVS